MTERFFLAQDNSSHWYVVPCSKSDEWEAWTALDEDDEASWVHPEWASQVGGSPSLVTFENPEVAP